MLLRTILVFHEESWIDLTSGCGIMRAKNVCWRIPPNLVVLVGGIEEGGTGGRSIRYSEF